MANEKPKLTEEPGDSPRSSRPTGSEIPDDWVCVGCGESFGEWSHVITEDCLASEEDSRSERIGDLECNYCGSQEWESPQNAELTCEGTSKPEMKENQ